MTKRTVATILTILLILPAFISLGGSFAAQKSLNFNNWDSAYEQSLADAIGVNVVEAQGYDTLSTENRYIVKFLSDATLNDIETALVGLDYAPISETKDRLFTVSLKNDKFLKDNEAIIEYSEPEVIRNSLAVVNDPVSMPSYDVMSVYSAWDISKGGEDIIVAVLDTGISRTHEDFANTNILAGYDAISRKAGVYEDSAGHGTAVAGLIAATANNGLGIAGIAHGVSILPVKVSASGTNIYSSDLIRGIRFAADAGAKIINMSIGGYSHSFAEQEAINYAKSKGCILVSAAGNGGNTEYADQLSYPASYDNVISVASCNDLGEHSSFSQSNEFVDIAAPGDNITIIAMDEEGNSIYRTDSGTSYSCAFVSGIAALAASEIEGQARFENEEFISLFIEACGITRNERLGYGVINAQKVVELSNLPIVTGVVNGGNYSESVTIGFNRGNALLGDEQLEDGETIVANGQHTLVVTDGENAKTVKFRVDHTPLSFEFREFSSYAYFEFERGNASLNGFPYNSKDRITTSGTHEFILTDGDEKITKTVDLKYSLPAVYGVENGKTYDKPIEITIVGEGSAYLNEVKFENHITVSESGEHTLTVKSGNGAVEKEFKFTINFDHYKHFGTDYENGFAAVDSTNGYFCLYGDSLVGARIYDISKPQKYKFFLSVGRVYSHAFVGDKLYLFGDSGITVIDRKKALTDKNSVISTFDSPLVTYYTYANGSIFGFGGNNMYIVDLETESTISVAELGYTCEKAFFYNEKFYLLAPSSDSIVRIFNPIDGTSSQYDLGYNIANAPICFGAGYISVGNRLYNADDGSLVFEFAGNCAIRIAGTRVYTQNKVFDFTTGKEIGSLPFTVSSIEMTKDANYLFGTNAECAVVTKNLGGVYDFGGAVSRDKAFSKAEQQTQYRTNLYYGKNSRPLWMASSHNKVYMLFADSFALYGINAESKTELPPVYLKYKPEKVMCSNEYIIISFANRNEIYVAKESDIENGTYISLPYSCRDAVIFGGKLVAVVNRKIVTVETETGTLTETEIDATAAATDGSNLFVLENGIISKYDTTLTKTDFEIAVSENGSLMIGNGIALGKTVYDIESGEVIATMKDTILAHKGNVVITKNGVFDLEANENIGRTGIEQPKFATICGNNTVVAVNNGRMSLNYCAEGEDITTKPNISGIEANGVYLEKTTVSYDHGAGYIDGKPFKSGDAISEVGKHIFLLSLPCGRNIEIPFNIEAKLSEIKFLAESITVSVGEKVMLHVAYLPEGARSIPVKFNFDKNGLDITESGEVTALTVGRYKVTAEAETESGVISAQAVITVRDDLIAFIPESGYIIDRNNMLVSGIAPGTTVSDFTALISTGKSVLITDKTGSAVTKHIGTGNKIVLTDENGKTTDELFAVVKGDTDGDGFISAYDLYELERILKGYQYTAPFVASADTNGNGVLADNDHRTLKKMLFGRIDADLGTPEDSLFGNCNIQTLSTVYQGDIIETAVCISGSKYARGVFGKIAYSEGLEFIEGDAAGWETDCFNRDGVISFYAFDEEGKSCDASFKILLTLRFKVNAQPYSKISFTADKFTVSYEDGCKKVAFENSEIEVSPRIYTDFNIEIPNAGIFKFSPAKHDYDITIPYNSALADINISHKVGERISATSFILPDSGMQTVVITFTDENGSTDFYNINVKRDAAPVIDSNCKLQELEVEGHKLSPSFNPEFFEYNITVPHGTEKITPYCVAQNASAEVVVGDTALKGEKTAVTVTVGTPDGESLTYTIHVKMLPPEEVSEPEPVESQVDDDTDTAEENDLKTLLTILGAVLLGAIITAIIVKLAGKATEKKE